MSSNFRFILTDTEFDDKSGNERASISRRLPGNTRSSQTHLLYSKVKLIWDVEGRQHPNPAATKLQMRVPQISSDEATNKTGTLTGSETDVML